MGKLTKPAQVGAGIFNVGVDEKLVIKSAQRQYGKNLSDRDRKRCPLSAARYSLSSASQNLFMAKINLAELGMFKNTIDEINDNIDDLSKSIKLIDLHLKD
jgi:hypothetical protein